MRPLRSHSRTRSTVIRTPLRTKKDCSASIRAAVKPTMNECAPMMMRTPTPRIPSNAGRKPSVKGGRWGRGNRRANSRVHASGPPGKSPSGSAANRRRTWGRPTGPRGRRPARRGVRPDGHFGVILQRHVAVGETTRDVEHPIVVGGQRFAMPSSEGWRPGPDVEHHIPDRTARAPHDLVSSCGAAW